MQKLIAILKTDIIQCGCNLQSQLSIAGETDRNISSKMFGGKKKAPPVQPQRDRSSLGIFDIPKDFDPTGQNIEVNPSDADLEAELAALMGGGSGAKKPPPKKKTPLPAGQLDSMVAACMKDYDSDEEIDENDDELLGELAELNSDAEDDDKMPPPPTARALPPQPKIEPLSCHGGEGPGAECAGQDLLSIIDNRISCYSQAERNAKEAGETGRARRFSRGLATLTDQRRKVLAGKPVNDSDIPPAVVITAAQSKKSTPVSSPLEEAAPTTPPTRVSPTPTPAAPAPVPAKPSSEPMKTISPITSPIDENLRHTQQRRTECRREALKAKETGDKMRALACVNAVKQCDGLLEKIKSGQSVDMSLLPGVPTAVIQYPRQEADNTQGEGPPPPLPQRQFSRDDPIQMPENPEDLPPADPAVYGAPPPPKTVMEALEQRLAKYKEDEAKAKAESNASRARRLGRICKQYTDAMKAHKAGRAIPVDELPTPPGFAPIPSGAPAAAATSRAAPGTQAASEAAGPGPTRGAVAAAPKPSAAPAAQKRPTTLRDKQILLLTTRQAEFKKAALEAKKSGQMEQAKEYLRQYKGFDQMIEAAKSGLPIDFKTLPVPPGHASGKKRIPTRPTFKINAFHFYFLKVFLSFFSDSHIHGLHDRF